MQLARKRVSVIGKCVSGFWANNAVVIVLYPESSGRVCFLFALLQWTYYEQGIRATTL